MTDEADEDELKAKRICVDCVGDGYLKELITKENSEADCAYCNKRGFAISIGSLAELVDEAFQAHFIRTSTGPSSFEYAMMGDRESSYTWSREGEPVIYAIAEAAEIDEGPAGNIAEVLSDHYGDFDSAAMGEETEYDGDSHYIRKDVGAGEWNEEWRSFEDALRTENRFFSPAAADYLKSLFDGLAKWRSDGAHVVVDAGPGTAHAGFYRARVFQSEGKLVNALRDADRELGPPSALAALAGRMNARGIAVFYGATAPTVALAEIRPPVGSRVVLGRFEVIRPLRLLDLTALGNVTVLGSIFDPHYALDLEKAAFLQTFGERITRPVMPDDEALDYVITQVVADYLATNTEHLLDGILFRSAQAPEEGVNAVLFHKASRVEKISRPAGTEVESSGGEFDEDGWQTNYRVVERIPKPALAETLAQPKGQLGYFESALYPPEDPDLRKASLRLDQETVQVRYVKGVKFSTDDHAVSFYRWKARE